MKNVKRFFCEITFFCVVQLGIYALPTDLEVVGGSVTIVESEGSSLHLQSSDKAVLHYQSFNIDRGEKVVFELPNSSSAVLNRVVGSDRSLILGSMESNGKVFFVNPNGVYFGKDAVVNVGSLVVSTLDLQDSEFFGDKWSFAGGGEILNEGLLIADDIALLGKTVVNHGTVSARGGKAVLVSGEKIVLDFSHGDLLHFAVEKGCHSIEEVTSRLVNTDGMVEGREIVIEGDEVLISGRIKGEEIHILGDKIDLASAKVDASREKGGGIVLIGGGFQGKGDLRTATYTSMDSKSEIYADALDSGDGGMVVLWSDGTTIFDGQIYARGGVQSGDGGLVETSGREELRVGLGNVSTMSPNGLIGDWLLDPDNIVISSLGLGSLLAGSDCGSLLGLTISIVTMNAALSNVVLCASNSITQTSGINIAFLIPGVGITFQASSGTITTFLDGSITTQGGAINFINSNVTLGSNSVLNTTGGGSGGAAISFGNAVNATSAGVETLSLNAGSSAVTFSGAVGATQRLGSLTITNSAAVNFAGSVDIAGALTQTNAATGTTTFGSTVSVGSATLRGTAFSVNNTFTATGAIAVTNSGTFTTASGATITAPSGFSTSGAATLGGNIRTTGTLLSIGGALTVAEGTPLELASENGTITISGTTNGTAGGEAESLLISAGTGTVNLAAIYGAGGSPSATGLTRVAIANAGTINYNGAIGITGMLTHSGNASTFSSTVSAGAMSLVGTTFAINNSFATTTGGIAIYNSGLLTKGSTGSITSAGGMYISGAANLSSNLTTSGMFKMAGTLTVGTGLTVTITTGNGEIFLDGATSGSGGGIILDSGTGILSVGSISGVAAATITNSGTAFFNGTINISGAFTQTNAATGNTRFSQSITAGSLTLRGTSFLLSAGATVSGATQVTNSEEFSSTGVVQSTGGFATSGDVRLTSNITTTNSPLTIGGRCTVEAGSTPTLSTANGNLTITGSTVGVGTGSSTLTLNAGSGALSMEAIYGSGILEDSHGLTDVTITNSAAASFSGPIRLTGAFTQTNAATGTTTFDGSVVVGSLTLRGVNFNVNNDVGATGAIAVTNSGTFTKNSVGEILGGGGFSTSGALVLGSNVTTKSAAISIGGALTIAEGLSLTLSTGGGGITIVGSTNGTAGGSIEKLTLDAGAGTIQFAGLFGAGGAASPTGLTEVTIKSANNMNFIGDIAITGTLYQTSGSGATTFSNPVSVGDAILDGVIFNLNNSFTATGEIFLINSGMATKNATGVVTAPLGFTVTGNLTLAAWDRIAPGTPLTVYGEIIIP